jgi:hypothetical protein
MLSGAALRFPVNQDFDAARVGEFSDVGRAFVTEQDQDNALTLVRPVIVILPDEATTLTELGRVAVVRLGGGDDYVNLAIGVGESGCLRLAALERA